MRHIYIYIYIYKVLDMFQVLALPPYPWSWYAPSPQCRKCKMYQNEFWPQVSGDLHLREPRCPRRPSARLSAPRLAALVLCAHHAGAALGAGGKAGAAAGRRRRGGGGGWAMA